MWVVVSGPEIYCWAQRPYLLLVSSVIENELYASPTKLKYERLNRTSLLYFHFNINSAMCNDSYLQSQLDVLLVLQSMYPLPSEFVLTPSTAHYIENEHEPGYLRPSSLEATLVIKSDYDENSLELIISLPTSPTLPSTSTSPGNIKLYIRQPPWLSRTAHEELLNSLTPRNAHDSPLDLILSTAENLRDRIPNYIPNTNDPCLDSVTAEESQELQRVWFWFPSLSTKEKRRDLVDYAPRYNLTGFVLAGTSPPPPLH
jgi:hypothetical protein